jgi:hypothetical protein
MQRFWIFCLVVGVLFTSVFPTWSDQGLNNLGPEQYVLRVPKIDTPPRIDGDLDDPVWQIAPVAKDFTQMEPEEGKPAKEQTAVYVLYDERNLYIGVMCYDSAPDKVVATEMRRDINVDDDDAFDISICTDLERGESYYFITNPFGSRRDAYVGKEGSNFRPDWDAVWECKAQRNGHGWAIEFAFPFKIFRFQEADEQVWGVNFGRHVQRTLGEDYWVPVSRTDHWRGMYKYNRGGRLVGLKGVKPGRAFEILPYAAGGVKGHQNTPGKPLDTETDGDIGVDIKYGITSDLTFDATVKPEFAQVESDPEVINLTRFAFFFNEKRPFFLEGAGLFGYGTSDFNFRNPLQLFHSRQIATQLPDGQKIPIDAAGKLSGKIGGWQLGLMNVQAGDITYRGFGGGVGREPKTSYSVARLRKDILSRSSIGFIGLLKDPEDEGYNGVLGVDGEFYFGPTRQVEVMVAKSRTPRIGQMLPDPNEEWGVAAGTRWRSATWGYAVYYTDIGKDFADEMGFVPRVDMRRYLTRVSITPLINRMGIRASWSGARFEYITDREDHLKTREVEINPSFQLENGMFVDAGVANTRDVLDADTPIEGIVFPEGDYTFNTIFAGLETSRGAWVSGGGFLRAGKLYDADVQNVSASLLLKPITGLSLNPTFDWSRLEREDGATVRRSVSRVLSLRARQALTPDFYVSAYLQIRPQRKRITDTFISNALVSYQTPTGHAFYIAYNEFRRQGEAIDRVVLAKLSYLWNI